MLKTLKSIENLKSLRDVRMKQHSQLHQGCTKEILVLSAIASATGNSIRAHVPPQAIFSRFERRDRGIIMQLLKGLARKGYVYRHPTRGGLTWHITKRGIETLIQGGNTTS